MVGLFNLFQSPSNRSSQAELPYSEFLREVNNGQVKSVVIEGNEIRFYKSSGTSFNVVAPDDPKLVERLMDQGVEVQARLADEEMPALPCRADQLVPDAAAYRCVDFLYASDAVGRWPCHGIWQITRTLVDGKNGARDI